MDKGFKVHLMPYSSIVAVVAYTKLSTIKSLSY